jgi:hypothetical protein
VTNLGNFLPAVRLRLGDAKVRKSSWPQLFLKIAATLCPLSSFCHLAQHLAGAALGEGRRG